MITFWTCEDLALSGSVRLGPEQGLLFGVPCSTKRNEVTEHFRDAVQAEFQLDLCRSASFITGLRGEHHTDVQGLNAISCIDGEGISVVTVMIWIWSGRILSRALCVRRFFL